MELIWEKAREIGRLIAQSDEFQAMKRASERLNEDRDAVTRLRKLQELEQSFGRAIQQGLEPPEDQQQEYEALLGEVQVLPTYQGFASAQANLDRLMLRVNEEIEKGIQAGEQSRIILPT